MNGKSPNNFAVTDPCAGLLQRARPSCLVAAMSAALLLFSIVGCNGPAGGLGADRQRPPQDTDIFKVVCSYPTKMWLSFDPAGDPNPEGFVFVMYLLSKKTGRGVYADGTFHAKIYRVDRSARHGQRALVLELNADMADLPKRKETVLGKSYQPRLNWGDLDIYGQEIDIVVEYESPTGRVVQSQTHTTRVPPRET